MAEHHRRPLVRKRRYFPLSFENHARKHPLAGDRPRKSDEVRMTSAEVRRRKNTFPIFLTPLSLSGPGRVTKYEWAIDEGRRGVKRAESRQVGRVPSGEGEERTWKNQDFSAWLSAPLWVGIVGLVEGGGGTEGGCSGSVTKYE
jgi:hypothetical protein